MHTVMRKSVNNLSVDTKTRLDFLANVAIQIQKTNSNKQLTSSYWCKNALNPILPETALLMFNIVQNSLILI